MDENKKRELKLVFKFYEYIMYALMLAFLVMGLAFGSIYIGKKVFTNEVSEVTKKSLTKNLASYDSDLRYVRGFQDRITDNHIDYAHNEYNCRDYIYLKTGGLDYNEQFRYVVEGDIKYTLNSTIVDYNQLIFEFDVHNTGTGYAFNIVYLQLKQIENGSSVRQLSILYNNNYTDVTFSYDRSNVSVASYGNIGEVYHCSVIDLFFENVYVENDATFFTFHSGPKNLPHFLNSYTRLQYGQIQYAQNATNTDSLTIPMVFESNGILYDNITLLMRPCWYYYNSAGLLVDNNAVTPSGQLVPYICAYVLYGYYGRTLDWTYDENLAGVLSSVSNGSLAMYLGYNGSTFNDDTGQSFWAPNYLLLPGLQVVTDYDTIRVANIDSIPFPNNTGTNLKPYNNLTIRNILGTYFDFYGDISGYNGTNYDVGLGNVFTLLSSAFQSFIPLLAIQIIPGITLGLLVMLPLVVTIILVILKLVKK